MPEGGGEVTTDDGRGSFDFEEGSFNSEAQITIERVPCGSAPRGFRVGGTCFRVTAVVDGEEVSQLTAPLTICIAYSSDDVAAAAGQPTDLLLAYVDGATGEWQVLPTMVDTDEGTVCALTSHLSNWAVLARTSGSSSSTWVYVVAGLGGLIIVLGVVFLVSRRPIRRSATP